jgi:GMP synthase-like glutamine amidotransferase
MKLLVVDNGTSYLQALLKLLAPHEVTVVPWTKFLPKDAESSDTVILSGGHSLTVTGHDQEYQDELGFIRETRLPVIGICLGFELIAHAFGANLRLLEAKEKGVIKLRFMQPHPLFLGVPEAEVFESHRWVVKNVPKPLVGLATSKDGYEIIAHESKPIFGFQFHPEMFPEKTVGAKIMHNCLSLIEAETAARK